MADHYSLIVSRLKVHPKWCDRSNIAQSGRTSFVGNILRRLQEGLKQHCRSPRYSLDTLRYWWHSFAQHEKHNRDNSRGGYPERPSGIVRGGFRTPVGRGLASSSSVPGRGFGTDGTVMQDNTLSITGNLKLSNWLIVLLTVSLSLRSGSGPAQVQLSEARAL